MRTKLVLDGQLVGEETHRHEKGRKEEGRGRPETTAAKEEPECPSVCDLQYDKYRRFFCLLPLRVSRRIAVPLRFVVELQQDVTVAVGGQAEGWGTQRSSRTCLIFFLYLKHEAYTLIHKPLQQSHCSDI